MSKRPRPLLRALTLLPVLTAGLSIAYSMPILQDRYNDHPLALTQNKDNCRVCHVYEDGSGPLSAFGKKYDRAGLEFTTDLIALYPNIFDVDGSSAEATPANASALTPVQTAVPGNEPFDAAKYYLAECKECHGKYGDGDPFQGVPAFATTKWLDDRSHQVEELLNIIMVGKDDMIGQAGKINEDEGRELLDIVLKIARKYS